MLDRDALILALQNLPTVALEGTTYRIIKNKYASSALSTIGSLRGGRYIAFPWLLRYTQLL